MQSKRKAEVGLSPLEQDMFNNMFNPVAHNGVAVIQLDQQGTAEEIVPPNNEAGPSTTPKAKKRKVKPAARAYLNMLEKKIRIKEDYYKAKLELQEDLAESMRRIADSLRIIATRLQNTL